MNINLQFDSITNTRYWVWRLGGDVFISYSSIPSGYYTLPDDSILATGADRKEVGENEMANLRKMLERA